MVDIEDLDIDSRVYKNSLTTEYWGSKSKESWGEIEIISVMYNGEEVELSDTAYDVIENYVIKQQE